MQKIRTRKLTAGQYFLSFYTIFLTFATDTSAWPLSLRSELM